MRTNLLEGIRVVEIGSMWAGPYAARIMADLGAEVIKIEGPRKPEPVRFGFYAANDPGEKPWERGGHFQKFGRNKLSLVLDITRPRGRELLYALLRKTDVLIENNTPRVRKVLGIDHETLAREAPDLVVVSMPGFGDTGPYRDYLAFGIQIEGFTGVTSVTGYDDGTPPIRSAIPYGDPVAAVYGAMTAILGLRSRRRGAANQTYEVSQHEGLTSLQADSIIEAQVTGKDPGLRANNDPLLAVLQGAFQATDGWLAVTVTDAAQLATLARLAGKTPAAAAPAVRAALARWAAPQTRAAAAEALAARGIAAGPVLSPGEMMHHEQVAARGVYAEVPHPIAGPIPYAQLPLHYAGAPTQPDRHAPLFGEHNHYVLHDLLGLDEAEIAALTASGLLADAPVLDLPAVPAAPKKG
jgi:crotonobetainyl-CoA:carnitine CoA-transferase CaiB-like acyl-CoA transferase